MHMDQGSYSHQHSESLGKLNGSSQRAVHDRPCIGDRLTIRDAKSGIRFLVDTGADISVLPKTWAHRKCTPSTFQLFAANGFTIHTYGEKKLHLNFGLRRNFSWIFIIADIAQPIIGIDFLKNFGLIVDIRRKRLIDEITGLQHACQLSHRLSYQREYL